MPLKGSGGAFVTAICSRITHAELLMCLFGMERFTPPLSFKMVELSCVLFVLDEIH